ncbi:uncharacterized protein HGUI_00675 [Hanseniaspora guilliermondii]|uniref:Trans-2-enoyl-CoA reductase, mitochondrial n=1 Tax=Hanseniaspora guilliermondii TaxID=56406 RepID=A0A1L0B0I6_9ASCO|nr:uncharacterized protein HGUI_00675 [Hanseniaspora guilliermondii]
MVSSSLVARNAKNSINKNYLFNIKPSSNSIPSTIKNIVYGIKEERSTPTHENIRVYNSSSKIVFPIRPTTDPKAIFSKQLTPTRASERVLLKTIAFPINPSDKNQIDGTYGAYNEKVRVFKKDSDFSVAGNEGLYQVQAFLNQKNEIIPDFEHSQYKVGDVVIPLVGNTGTWCDYKILPLHAIGYDKYKPYWRVTSEVDLTPEGTRGFGILEAATAAVNGSTALGFANLFQKNAFKHLRRHKGKENVNKTDFYCYANAGNSQVSKLFSQIVHSDYSHMGYKEYIGDHLKTISIIRERSTPEETEEFIKRIQKESKTDIVITETINQDKGKSKEFMDKFKDQNVNFVMAINSVGGSSVSGIERKLSADAKVYTYGGMSLKGVVASTTSFIFKNITYLGFWITRIFKENDSLKLKYINSLASLYDSKQISLSADDYEVIEWKVKSDSDEAILAKIQEGIKLKGKKPIVYVNHEE